MGVPLLRRVGCCGGSVGYADRFAPLRPLTQKIPCYAGQEVGRYAPSPCATQVKGLGRYAPSRCATQVRGSVATLPRNVLRNPLAFLYEGDGDDGSEGLWVVAVATSSACHA